MIFKNDVTKNSNLGCWKHDTISRKYKMVFIFSNKNSFRVMEILQMISVIRLDVKSRK